MPTDGLYPSYVKIDYTTPYSPHVMTLPLLRWTGGGIGDAGVIATHAGGTTPTTTMIEGFIDLMMDAYYINGSTSVGYTVYNIPNIGDDPQPVFGKNYAAPGTIVNVPADDIKAWVATLIWRTTNFGLSKLLLIECARGGFTGKQTGALSGAYAAIDAFLTDTGNGFAGRDNGRPAVYLSTNYKPNDRLIREYKGLW